MKKLPFVAANWKMNFTIPDALKFVTAFTHELKAFGNVEVLIAPPMTALYSTGVALAETPIKLASQNMFWEDNGAFTGEVSGPFLKDIGCDFVIIGHSERRKYFGDTDDNVNKKVHASIRNDLTPILCIGESLKERENNQTWEICENQLKKGLSEVNFKDSERFIVAYEPVWAIGTGKTATTSQAQEVHQMIREWLVKKYDRNVAENTHILYGGSVKAKNSQELIEQPDIDGFLVGGASLDPIEFANIIRNSSNR